MPTPKKKKPYAVIREDNSYVVYDLDSDQFDTIVKAIMGEMKHALVSGIGLLGLKGVRDVIEQRPEDKQKEKKVEKQIDTGLPEMDAISLHWLKEQKEMMNEWDEDSEVDGGRFS